MKKAALTILGIVSIYLLISAFLPANIHVERSVEINVDQKNVFNQINTLPNWKNWSFWDNIDPNMQSEYEGPVSGPGAIHKWKSNNDSVGTGSLTILEASENVSLKYSLYFEGMGVSEGGFNLEPQNEATTITMYMNIHMPLWGRIFPGLWMDDWLGRDFEKSLSSLKSFCENNKSLTSIVWRIEETIADSKIILSKRQRLPMIDFQKSMAETFTQLYKLISDNGIEQTGPPRTVYHQWNISGVDFEPAIPVNKTVDNISGAYSFNKTETQKVIVLDYYGDYPGTEKAHEYISEWAKENNITITGAPWEEYITDPEVEPDTSRWLTRICYPVL